MSFIMYLAPLGAVMVLLCSDLGFAQEQVQNTDNPPAQAQAPGVRSTRFDDWYLRCVDVKDTGDRTVQQCEVAQVAQVQQGEGTIDVLTLAIAKVAPEAGKNAATDDFLLTALVPLNVVLPIGLVLAADDKDLGTIPYRNCNEVGCWAQKKLDQKTVAALQKGAAGQARLRLMNGKNINLKFSLKGLSRALAELQKPSKA